MRSKKHKNLSQIPSKKGLFSKFEAIMVSTVQIDSLRYCLSITMLEPHVPNHVHRTDTRIQENSRLSADLR